MTASTPAGIPADSTLFHRLGGSGGTAAVLLIGWLTLSGAAPEATAPTGSCAGYLRGQVFGARTMDLDWSGEKLACEGMSRPDGRGIRLQFAWDQGDDERLVLVVGIDGTTISVAGPEKPANVTFIDERSGHFYSSLGTGRCWTDIVRLAPLPVSGLHRLKGRLYCTGALPALNDRSSLTLGDLHYYGDFALDDN
ncbi:MAG: hypothetical protein KJ040_06315 [Gammaproteobacteria bacterium]|nr:hypothetical protein [Gammaproteobacteria bacterium]